MVKLKYSSFVCLDHFEAGNDLRGILFLLHLFVDEPLQHHLRGIVLLFQRQFIQGIDRGCDFGFVRGYFFKKLKITLPIRPWALRWF